MSTLQTFWDRELKVCIFFWGGLMNSATKVLYGEWEKLSPYADDPLSYYHHSPEKFLQRQETVGGFGNSLGLSLLSWSQEKTKRGRLVMLPHSKTRILWSCFGLLLVFWDAISIPLLVSWDISNTFFFALTLLAMIYWSIDMLLSSQTGFFEQGELVLSGRRVLMHYLKSCLVGPWHTS